MKKKPSILRLIFLCFLFFWRQIAPAQDHKFPVHQILQLHGVFVNEQPIEVDFKTASKLNNFLSADFEVPYSIFKNGVKGTGKYKLVSKPALTTSVVTSISPGIDSICLQQLKHEEFLATLPFSYRAVKQVTFSIYVNLDPVAAKRVIRLPLHSLGDLKPGLNSTRYGAQLSGKKEFLSAKKGGTYEIRNGAEEFLINPGAGYSVQKKTKFTVDGSVWSILTLSKDSALIIARNGTCCDPVILTEYVLTKGAMTVRSKTELYGLNKYLVNNETFSIQAIRNNRKFHYLKMSNEPLSFHVKYTCSCTGVKPPASVAGVKPAGNVVGLLKDNAIVYRLVNSKITAGVYGVVEVNHDVAYKMYVGGWIE